jgi:hypothetical protein
MDTMDKIRSIEGNKAAMELEDERDNYEELFASEVSISEGRIDYVNELYIDNGNYVNVRYYPTKPRTLVSKALNLYQWNSEIRSSKKIR